MNSSSESFSVGAGGFVPPNPGGAHPAAASGAAGPSTTQPRPGRWAASGTNPLVAAANPLLNLVPQIRSTVHHPNPAWLREHLVVEIRQFEARAQAAGVASEAIIGARYCLCTALDEAAALTPWGGSVWSSHSLLVSFHNETWGGEKFFHLLDRLSQQPRQHLDLLELLYFCLALGFEGRYRVLDNGHGELDALRRQLAQTIRSVRGEFDAPLSPHWRDVITRDVTRRFAIPLWVCAALALLIGFGVFAGLRIALAGHSDRLFASIDALHVPHLRPVQAAPKPELAPRVSKFLEPEIAAGLVAVRDDADRSVIVMRGDGVFKSGSTSVIDRFLPVLSRVADALNKVPGHVRVSGYTDDTPVHTARFASNWDLSRERAEAVRSLLAARLDHPERLAAEGRGTLDPVAPNDTLANRALNRRVEITLMPTPAGGAASAPQEANRP
ncbi:OmpA/MotB family outer membrane protein [Caballeronia calidae]|uniref:OmpA/MotB family outer membrane protein n=1 Tax=Caballeronia calidae TaxID=1777139 RepID=A0A158CL70_9BURK|nr:DotU family type VI secretion system protein [Caballeronia calidae]SAK83020.1 OmpA/MotB family outer membrane protein [Caballeronia calidae]